MSQSCDSKNKTRNVEILQKPEVFRQLNETNKLRKAELSFLYKTATLTCSISLSSIKLV